MLTKIIRVDFFEKQTKIASRSLNCLYVPVKSSLSNLKTSLLQIFNWLDILSFKTYFACNK